MCVLPSVSLPLPFPLLPSPPLPSPPPRQAFHPKGRGHVLAKRYGAMDVAWMTDTYASLRQKQER